MVEQSVFMETVHAVSEIIRTSAAPMSREEILSYFKEMDLTKQQEDMVLEYLTTPQSDDAAQSDVTAQGEVPPLYDEDGAEAAAGGGAEDGEIPLDGDDAEAAFGGGGARGADHAEDGAHGGGVILNSKIFQLYREELAGLPTYSAEEMRALYGRLLAGDKAVIHTVSDGWLRRIVDMAEKLSDTADGFEDVVQEGNLALFLKLDELCGAGNAREPDGAALTADEVETRLATAAADAIKSAIVSKESEREDEKAVVGKVALVGEAQKHLKKENGAAPSLKELADYTKLDEEELSDLLALVKKTEKKE